MVINANTIYDLDTFLTNVSPNDMNFGIDDEIGVSGEFWENIHAFKKIIITNTTLSDQLKIDLKQEKLRLRKARKGMYFPYRHTVDELKDVF